MIYDWQVYVALCISLLICVFALTLGTSLYE